MLITARTTGVQTVAMNGDSNTRVMWQCLGRNGKTERSWVVAWKPRVTAQMRRGEAAPDGGTRNRKRLWWIYLHRFLPKYDTAVIKFVATVPKYPHTAIKCSRRCKDNSPVDFKLSQSSLWRLKSNFWMHLGGECASKNRMRARKAAGLIEISGESTPQIQRVMRANITLLR